MIKETMEERFKEKFSNMPLFSIVENGKRKLVYGAILDFIHQERQLAKKECILGLIDELSLVPVKNTYLLASDLHYYAKQNNITLE